jgi:uncharacterized protein DUF4338
MLRGVLTDFVSQPVWGGPLVFGGRTFSVADLELIRGTAVEFGALGVTEISRTVCELLQWQRPNGGLKNLECRRLLEELCAQGRLSLPALRVTKPRGPQVVRQTTRSDAQAAIGGSAGPYEPLHFELLRGGGAGDNELFREYLQRYHYQGYRVPFGAHLRYLVRSEYCPERVLACLLWTSPAWKLAERDRWIGWSVPQRERNLQFIVNHGRFLILPWVRVKGLASKILAHCARLVPADWETLYGYRPLLLETLVDAERFRGTCYQAANWIRLGVTQGRGRMDRYHEAQGTAKDLYVYPLCRRVQERLVAAVPPVYREPCEETLAGEIPTAHP